MTRTVRYLTHPQIRIEPTKNVPAWSLNDVGTARVSALAQGLGLLVDTGRIICSAETKAMETAQPLAKALNIDLEVRPRMHENDRSATGFLPPEEFEKVADAFLANPSQSVRGWETAEDAQRRIVEEVESCLSSHREGNDPEKPMVTSGILVGSAAGTSRGLGADEYRQIAALMLDTLHAVHAGTLDADLQRINERIRQLVARFLLPYLMRGRPFRHEYNVEYLAISRRYCSLRQ